MLPSGLTASRAAAPSWGRHAPGLLADRYRAMVVTHVRNARDALTVLNDREPTLQAIGGGCLSAGPELEPVLVGCHMLGGMDIAMADFRLRPHRAWIWPCRTRFIQIISPLRETGSDL